MKWEHMNEIGEQGLSQSHDSAYIQHNHLDKMYRGGTFGDETMYCEGENENMN
jgi:hypothetical protein